jgi:hypothetical protein
MMNQFLNFGGGYANGMFFGGMGAWFLLLIVWSLIWKGLALWKAAREGSKAWFVVLLVLNTAGILDILYLYVFSGKKELETEQKDQSNS